MVLPHTASSATRPPAIAGAADRYTGERHVQKQCVLDGINPCLSILQQHGRPAPSPWFLQPRGCSGGGRRRPPGAPGGRLRPPPRALAPIQLAVTDCTYMIRFLDFRGAEIVELVGCSQVSGQITVATTWSWSLHWLHLALAAAHAHRHHAEDAPGGRPPRAPLC